MLAKGMTSRLVITPLKKELEGLVQGLEKMGLVAQKEQDQGRWYFVYPDENMILTTGGHGKVEFGIQTQFWIEKFKPKMLISIGAAGALSRHVDPLDVVVASEIIEHDYHEKFNPSEKPPLFECQGLKNPAMEPKGFSLHLGRIASGDEDIVDPVRAKELYITTRGLAVAWESAGGARAARFNKIPYLEIRGITDNAREDVPADFIKNLPTAMDHCAQVLFHEINS